MRENRERNEPRSSELTEQSATVDELIDAYQSGFDAGFEEARQHFAQTQYLIFHTEGHA